jgi:ABC-type transport system involved in multi-copper enzyme maturation permease subunit
MSERIVPATSSTVWTLAAVTLKRLGRGKALWIGALIAALPPAFAVVFSATSLHTRQLSRIPDDLFNISVGLLVMLPAMFVGASIGEEIEERTSTYLWSRPIARWVVLAGKLCALTPIVIVLIVGGWYAGGTIWAEAAPSLTSCIALAGGCVATSLVAAGIATVVPKHGMALTIGYMLVDLFIGAMPFSLNELSITNQMRELADLSGGQPAITTPLIAMIAVSGLWAAVGFVRIRRLEV